MYPNRGVNQGLISVVGSLHFLDLGAQCTWPLISWKIENIFLMKIAQDLTLH